MKKSEIIIEAVKLISDPARWTRGTFARNECGVEVGPNDEMAVCWCGAGAVVKASGPEAMLAVTIQSDYLYSFDSPLGLDNDASTTSDKVRSNLLTLADELKAKGE